MKLLSWNVRGLGKAKKKGRIRKLLRERQVEIALFQETKNPQFQSMKLEPYGQEVVWNLCQLILRVLLEAYYAFGIQRSSSCIAAAVIGDSSYSQVHSIIILNVFC
ncbi:hypothetical protein ACSBR2_020393 [Camellia fascicularis]